MKAVLTLYLGVSLLFAVSPTSAPGRAGLRMKAMLTLCLQVSPLIAVSWTAAPSWESWPGNEGCVDSVLVRESLLCLLSLIHMAECVFMVA